MACMSGCLNEQSTSGNYEWGLGGEKEKAKSETENSEAVQV